MNTFKIIFISAIISYSVIFIFNEEVIKKETKQNFVEMKELLAEKGNEISSVKYTIEYNRQDMLERESPIECKRTKTIIDLKTGTLGGLKPTDTRESIMKKFPCFNYNYMGDDNYGGGVFYNDHAFYFYTNAKSIEIRKKFRGLMSSDDNSAQFMNFVKNDKDTIKKQLSDYGFDLYKEKKVTTDRWSEYILYKTSYGCLFIGFKDDRPAEIIISYEHCAYEGKNSIIKKYLKD